MKTLLFGLIALFSLSATANEIAGLDCSTEYIVHSVMRTPYNSSRVILRKSLLGGHAVLGFLPVNNEVKNYQEGFNLINHSDAITYDLDIQAGKSVLSIKVRSKESEVILIDRKEFMTREGIHLFVPLLDLVQMGETNVRYVVLTCLPSY